MRVTLILPDKKNNGEDWEQTGILSSLCQHEGGFTVYPSMEGWYYSESFGIIREVVKIIVCESQSSVEYRQGVAREVCALAEQESVYLQFDNDAPHFVSGNTAPIIRPTVRIDEKTQETIRELLALPAESRI